MWDVKGQTAKLVCDVKEHKKAVTCFAHFEPGDGLLSGSADKTVRVNISISCLCKDNIIFFHDKELMNSISLHRFGTCIGRNWNVWR